MSAHTNDPNQIEKPEEAGPSGALNSVLGLGLHKCPARSFLDQTMPEIFRVIFKQKDLKRASGRKGQLKPITLRPNAAPWDSKMYLTEDGGFSYYPRQMVIEFNSNGLQKQKSVDRKDVTDGKYKSIMIRGCTMIVVIFLLIMILHVISLLIGWPSPTPPLATLAQTKTQCDMPLMTIENWHIRTFRPEWFGLFGEPAPIIYRTPRGRKAHQISVVDLDKRDIELSLWVGKDYTGSRDVELDSTVDCGEDIGKCLELDFASALVVVPPGRHTIRAEIRKRNASEAFVWGKARRRRVMWLVQQCA
ncbi:hypothetical protein AX14_006803 [Amanita brunnescens Koide BX004]|nr:hypothetical protein AX14_006803 [Amanita brunnescens Koide BX004]